MVATSEAPIKLQTIVARHLRISATHPLVSPQNSWCHQRSVSKDCWEEGRSPSKPTEVAGDSDGRHLSKLRSDNTPQSVEKPLENTKAHQSTNIFEPRTRFVFQFLCIPASSLLSKTSLHVCFLCPPYQLEISLAVTGLHELLEVQITEKIWFSFRP